MKVKIITSSEKLEQFISREDITINKIDIKPCDRFVAVVIYEENTNNNTYWQSFRAEAAKDILCKTIDFEEITASGNKRRMNKERAVTIAISYADELIKQLKEKEEKK